MRNYFDFHVKLTLLSWNKTCLVMRYYHFYMLLILCLKFFVYVHERYWPVIYFFLVISLLSGLCWPCRLSWEVVPPPSFSESVQNWCYFSLEYFVEFTSEPHVLEVRFCFYGKVFVTNSVSSIDRGLFIFFVFRVGNL